MPDIYTRKLGIRGKKKYVVRTLEFMAKNASRKAENSYLYEAFLKPNEFDTTRTAYGVTKNFDDASDMDEVRFFSTGYMTRTILSEIGYEDVFREIAKENPQVELYGEVHNEGGIQETQCYLESFYSPAESWDLEKRYIKICSAPYDEDYSPDREPFFSEEEIESEYLDSWGKPKSYFETFFSKEENPEGNRKNSDFYYISKCAQTLWKEIKVSGFDTNDIKERFENLKNEEMLLLKPNEFGNIELFSTEGHVGTLSEKGNFGFMMVDEETGEILYLRDVLQILNYVLHCMPDSIYIKIVDVTPLSQRRKNAKYALIDFELVLSETLQMCIQKEKRGNSDFLKEVVKSIYNQAGFTFDGGSFYREDIEEAYLFSAEKRLQNFFDDVPCYYKESTFGYLEMIVCDAKDIEDSSFDRMMCVTNTTNSDGSKLFAKYWKQGEAIDGLEQECERTIARFCKKFSNYRIYGKFGITEPGKKANGNPFAKYFYSEQKDAVCRLADKPNKLLHNGGQPLDVPTEVTNTDMVEREKWIFVNHRGSIENFNQ